MLYSLLCVDFFFASRPSVTCGPQQYDKSIAYLRTVLFLLRCTRLVCFVPLQVAVRMKLAEMCAL